MFADKAVPPAVIARRVMQRDEPLGIGKAVGARSGNTAAGTRPASGTANDQTVTLRASTTFPSAGRASANTVTPLLPRTTFWLMDEEAHTELNIIIEGLPRGGSSSSPVPVGVSGRRDHGRSTDVFRKPCCYGERVPLSDLSTAAKYRRRNIRSQLYSISSAARSSPWGLRVQAALPF